ncbi:MAG: RNA polymerase sigma factor [Gammaproteobacteria bacterium]|nr:RNA polymerase sigma factor [Gammaproteobacteria bacterium]
MLSDREILELAEKARAGEKEAFGKLADDLRPVVCRWALVMTADPDDAEDVAQSVVIKMLTSITGFSGRSGVTSWLYRMTRNASLDHLRGKRRNQRLAEKLGQLAQAETPRLEDPLDELEMKRTLRLIRTLLSELPMRQREVFDLVELQGWKPIEATRCIGFTTDCTR